MTEFARATITMDGDDGWEDTVHFNPATLRITTTNQLKDEGPRQVAKPTSYKLDVELFYDTTDSGADVTNDTVVIRTASRATAQGGSNSNSNRRKSLPSVIFKWGSFAFRGVIETVNEALEYWSSDGVPLRSTLQLSIKGEYNAFDDAPLIFASEAFDSGPPLPDPPEIIQSSDAFEADRSNDKPSAPAGDSVTKKAQKTGDKTTGRGLAAANGIENMRAAGAGAGLGVSAGGGASLSAAAGFKMSGGVSAGASIGFGAGASAGLSAGAGLSASAGVGMSAGAGFGASAGAGFGASAGAGFGASAGAGFGASAEAGFGASAGAGFGASASSAFGASASAGFGASASAGFSAGATSASSFSSSSFTTSSSSSSSFSSSSASASFGSASAGMSASAGAFAGLGTSKTALPPANFNIESLLPPPSPAPAGDGGQYDVSGRVVSGNGQVAASYEAHASWNFG
ncbi:MAG: hypothetical protein V3V15_01270 [Sphingorhabdus sp.]